MCMDLRGPHQLGRRGERKGTEGGNLPLSWCPSPLPPLFEPVRLGTPPTPAAPLSRSASPPPPRYGPSRYTTETGFMSSQSAAPAGRAAVVAVQITPYPRRSLASPCWATQSTPCQCSRDRVSKGRGGQWWIGIVISWQGHASVTLLGDAALSWPPQVYVQGSGWARKVRG